MRAQPLADDGTCATDCPEAARLAAIRAGRIVKRQLELVVVRGAKEDLEEMWLTQQFHASQQKLYADFMTYKQEMHQRRMRFANKVGPQITLEQAYHVPFWKWWGEYLNRKY